MSDSNRIRVSIVPESTFGVTPATPAFQVLATTGVSLRDRIGYQQSATINNDRNVQDLIRLSKAAGGGVPMELTWSPSGEGLMQLVKAAMAGAETAAVSVAPVTTAGGDKIISRATGSFVSDGFEVGDIVRTYGSVIPGNHGYFKVTVVASGALTVEADANFAADATGDLEVVRGARIKNGTVETFFTIEVAYLDLDKARLFTGCAVDGLDFTIADQAVTTANFGFQSASSSFVNASIGSPGIFITGATYTVPTVSPVLDAIGVPEIRSQGVAYAAKSVNMSILNNVAPRTQIGGLGAQSMRFGEFGASGRITAFHEDFTELTAYASNTATDLWLVMIDENSKGFSLSFPQVKYSDAGADVSGSNTDILLDLAATAIKDPVELITARLQRWN